jgi:hypothetical protein
MTSMSPRRRIGGGSTSAAPLLASGGVFSLTGNNDNPCDQCVTFLLTGTGDDALEVIETAFQYADTRMRGKSDRDRQQEGLKMPAEEAIEELNQRLLEHSVGYRFEGGLLVRIDSEYLHREVTEPAIRLLREEGFEGALEEFTNAHAHYRKGEAKDANVDALNALESTLKAICDVHRWKYSPSASGAGLISRGAAACPLRRWRVRRPSKPRHAGVACKEPSCHLRTTRVSCCRSFASASKRAAWSRSRSTGLPSKRCVRTRSGSWSSPDTNSPTSSP